MQLELYSNRPITNIIAGHLLAMVDLVKSNCKAEDGKISGTMVVSSRGDQKASIEVYADGRVFVTWA